MSASVYVVPIERFDGRSLSRWRIKVIQHMARRSMWRTFGSLTASALVVVLTLLAVVDGNSGVVPFQRCQQS